MENADAGVVCALVEFVIEDKRSDLAPGRGSVTEEERPGLMSTFSTKMKLLRQGLPQGSPDSQVGFRLHVDLCSHPS